MLDSASQNWWLDSGAYFSVKSGIGGTVQGNLAADDPWRTQYLSVNPTDTDDGFHPQNIFRLLERNRFHNTVEQAYFMVTNDNLSDSPNRFESNGLLLWSRYRDSSNLYYAGLRVDGTLIIKKKKSENYYDIAQTQILPGTYDRTSNPNLIPHNQWIGLKSVVSDNSNGTVDIKLYTDMNNSGNWTLSLEGTDNGSSSVGGSSLTASGYAGIRTDFMDVQFKDYRIGELQ
jgi:hypothetical protein